jgi:hypothetical protein
MNRAPGGPIAWLCAGIAWIIWGALGIIDGKAGLNLPALGQGRQIDLVDWVGWVILPVGIIICILSIRTLWRGPIKYSDEDVARATDALDRMYVAEHGVWPKEQDSLLKEIDPKEDA